MDDPRIIQGLDTDFHVYLNPVAVVILYFILGWESSVLSKPKVSPVQEIFYDVLSVIKFS